jgi:hypothetical protein
MKSVRNSLLAMLMLAAAAAVAASPAFATPNLTASSGNNTPLSGPHSRAAVAPYITESTGSNSLFTGVSSDAQVILPSLGVTVRCREAHISGYASTTHTQVRLTSVSFGNVADASNCTSSAGTVDVQPITCTATTQNPWYLHFRAVNAGARSASGTINLTSSCTIRMTVLASALVVSFDGNQSCRAGPRGMGIVYTWNPSPSLLVDCEMVATFRGTINLSSTIQLRATYTLRPDTRFHPIITVTSSS